MDRPFAVYLLDCADYVRGSVEALIARDRGTVISCATISELELRHRRDDTGCVIMNVCPVGGHIANIIDQLRLFDIYLPVIGYGTQLDLSTVMHLLKCGVVAFLETPIRSEPLEAAILEAISTDTARRLHRSRRGELEARLAQLTSREREVLWMVAAGMANKKIATTLDRSEKTVEIHRAKAKRKLKISSIVQLLNLLHEYDHLCGEGNGRLIPKIAARSVVPLNAASEPKECSSEESFRNIG